MIDTFLVKNFKNLKSLELQGLKRLNLFTGKNNTGKSTLLEAVVLDVSNESENPIFQFIKSNTGNGLRSDYLWDQITLTEKEAFVIEALQIIEPDIQRIAFIGEASNYRIPVVKAKGHDKVVPLKSMGDGINRILSIILSAVNCENGYLLIDEFENGLHFSVQEQLWKVLIHLSSVLNIQIFATTHSNDCIDGFENAIKKSEDSSIGVLFRLEKDDQTGIKAVKFDLDEVKIATEGNIEIR